MINKIIERISIPFDKLREKVQQELNSWVNKK